MSPAYQGSWWSKGIITSVLLVVILPGSAAGYTEVYELEHNNRRLLVNVIYHPNEDLPLERAIANQTADFVSDVYEARGTVSVARRDYDYTGRRVLISVVDALAVDQNKEKLAEIFTAEKVIGSIELVYTTSLHLVDTSLIKRIQRWASQTDLTNATDSLQADDESTVVAEIKKFAVQRKPENRTLGALLAYLAVTLGMKRSNLPVISFPEAADVGLVVAETKPGAHVLIYRSLGMEEVYRIPHDRDFLDGRGLSLLRGVPATILEKTLKSLLRLHPDLPKLETADLGRLTFEDLYNNNVLNESCSKAQRIIRQIN